MKKLNLFLSICLFLFTISLVVVSCGKEDIGNMEENAAETIVDDEAVYRDDNGGVGPDDLEGPLVEAYYSWIKCGSKNAPAGSGGIAELEEYYLTDEQCRCFTEQWLYEKCIDPTGNDFPTTTNIIFYCERTNTRTIPYGALCQ